MSSKNIRLWMRYAHLIEGALIAAYIYSPSLKASAGYEFFVQFIVLPFIILSGLIMWQLPAINKWRNQRRQHAIAK